MADATVLYFGIDECLRVPVLRSKGYDVRVSDSLHRLRQDLERNDDVDLVIVSEPDPRSAAQAARLVRERSGAPLILFRRPGVEIDTKRFDRVLPWTSPEAHWLFDTAVLVMQCKELRAQFHHLRKDTDKVLAESRRHTPRARAEATRKLPPMWPVPKPSTATSEG